MYSRFMTWQPNPYLAVDSQSGDQNLIQLSDDAIDTRFHLKGYGFKRVGEQNRQVYHFGCYKCSFRKVGDPSFKLFAHVTSERADSEDTDVYKDIAVACGTLPAGAYEIKVEACKLVEFGAWAGGIVEGISSGDKFYYNLAAKVNVPIRVRVADGISIGEFAYTGFDPVSLMAGQAYDEIVQALELLYINMPLNVPAQFDNISFFETVVLARSAV